jgi:hypothetical protein
MGLRIVHLEVHHRAQVIDVGENLNSGVVLKESKPGLMPR